MLFSPGWRAPVRQGTILAIFACGLVLGGSLTGSVLWLLSGLSEPLPGDVRVWAVVALAGLALLREAGLVPLPLPQNARQIPQDVLQRNIKRGSLRFGFELGTGVRTYVSASAPYVVALGLVIARPGLAATLLTSAAFGLGRALTAALAYVTGDSWDERRLSRLTAVTTGIAVTLLAAFTLLALR